jgi:hypothetical protein
LENLFENLRPLKISSKKKVETFFVFFLGFDPIFFFFQNNLYIQTKIKRRFGVFLELRKSKSHFGVFVGEDEGVFFGEIEEVDLGYFLLKIKN